MQYLSNFKLALAAVFSIAIAGCGGGGGGADAPVAPAPPAPPAAAATIEGVYSGTITGSLNNDFEMIVLENNQFWALYGTQTPTQFVVNGFIQGDGVTNQGAFISTNARDFGFSPAVAGVVNATFNTTARTISGTVAAPAGTVTFSGGPIAGSLYNYNTPALLSSVVGSWNLTTLLTGERVMLNVAPNGAFNATSTFGCSFSGALVPRPSGKNVFNMALTFGPAPCLLSGQPASGIALVVPLPTGGTQLIFAGTNTDRNVGTVAFGNR